MERGTWSEIGKDSNIWKKLAFGAICLLTLLPIPVALGAVSTDLENELERVKNGTPSGPFPDVDRPTYFLGRGLAPAFIFLLALMAFCLPTVVVLMSSFQTYGWLKNENGVAILSLLTTCLFGLLALVVQFFVTALFPVALAQYARGLNIKPAIDPMANFGFIFEMGMPYWVKASGWYLFHLGYIVVYILGPAWWINLPLQLLFAGVGYASLIVSSRYAASQLQTRL